MSRRLGPRAIAGALLAWASLATSAASAEEPIYRQRLRVPVADDQISYAHCVTADLHTGEVFVCDPQTNRILIFDRDGFFSHQINAGEDFVAPQDLAVDPDGLLVVLATRGRDQRIVELDFDGLFRREVPLVGLPEGSVEPSLASIALSPAGDRLYAADVANLRLWVADRDGRVLGSADLGEGLRAEDRDDLILGHLDAYEDRVLLAVASLGQVWMYDRDGASAGFVGQQGGSRCQVARPSAAALDRDGNVLIVDEQRMVLMRWAVRGNRCLAEYLGIGDAPGYLYYPFDLSLDARGRLYIAQSYEGRVQVYEGLSPAAAPRP